MLYFGRLTALIRKVRIRAIPRKAAGFLALSANKSEKLGARKGREGHATPGLSLKKVSLVGARRPPWSQSPENT